MPDSFGLKIGIEGEREFRSALRDINQAFKVLGSEMQLVTSQFDKNDKSAQALTSRNTVLNKEIDAQKEKIATLRAALDNAASSFGDTDKRTQEWQIKLNKAEAELNGMERELSQNNKTLDASAKGFDKAEGEVDEFGKALDGAEKELDDTGKETKNLGKEMDETGKKTSVFGDVLKASLAADAIKAGLTAIVDMVKSVGAAVKDYVSDSMGLASAATESQTLLTQVMRNTMDASDGQVQSLVRLAEQQEKVGVVSKTAQVTALAELASFVERRESLEDMLPVMNDYIAYQYGATASSEQARNVSTALGKAINGSIDGLAKQGFTLTQNEKEWFKTAGEMERVDFIINMVGESMDGVNEALAKTDAGKMANLATVMDNTKISVGTMANEFKAQILGQMLPSISSLSGSFVNLIQGKGSIEDMAGAFDGVFNQVSNIITDFLPTLITLGSDLIIALVTGVSNNMDTVIEGALTVVDMLVSAILDLLPIILDAGTKLLFGLIDGIIKVLPSLVEAAIKIIVSLVKGIGDALPRLIPAAVEAVITIVKSLIDSLPMILNAALQLILGLAEGLLAALPQLIAALPTIIAAILDFLIGAIPQIIEAGVKLLISLVTALPEIIATIIAVIPQIIASIITAVIQLIPEIINAGIDLLVSLIGALPEIIQAIIEAIPIIVKGIVDAIIGNVDKIIQAGISLFIALVKALPTIIVEIVKAVPQIISAIVNGFTSSMGQMVNIGSDLIKGLWQGIANVTDWIMGKIKGFMNAILKNIKGFFGINSPSTVFAGLGKNMGEGLGIGFEDEMDKVARDMQNAIPTNFDVETDVNVRGNVRGRGGVGADGGSGTVINQHIAITSPKALSEKEAAREFQKLSRKLALETI